MMAGPATGRSPDPASTSEPASTVDPSRNVEPEPRISAALARLSECDQLTPRSQVDVFADVHRRLAEVLADPRAQG